MPTGSDAIPSVIDRLRVLTPRLSGMRAVDRAFACLGALAGIGLTAILCAMFATQRIDMNIPLLVAPIGASAVLLFAVPASPMAQPWAIIGGNTISALIGIATNTIIEDPVMAGAVAVSLAIVAMSLTRCLHPPGGAAALTAVLGGGTVASAGFMFAFVPVALNCVVLVAIGWLFHKCSGHSYPHRVSPVALNTHGTRDVPVGIRLGFQPEDLQGALDDAGETYDIAPDDLDRLLRRVETRAFERTHGGIRCVDIMSRDVVHIDTNADTELALALLLDHDVRVLPVVGNDGRVTGIVGLRQLARRSGTVGAVMMEVTTGFTDQPVSSLLASLTDGQHHAIVVVDKHGKLAGIITQTDLLAAMVGQMAIT